MQTFFVTGAMGFIGSHWSEFLLKRGHKVIGLDLGPRAPHLMDYKNFYFVQDTIKNFDLLSTLVDRSDVVCHFAGIASPDQYVKFPRKVIDVTARCSLELIERCRMREKLFFFTSTSEICGKNPKVPFTEEDDRVLGSTSIHRWSYSTSKALVEHYLAACAMAKELDYIAVRLFNVYGSALHGRVVSTYIENALRGQDLVIHGDGSQTRSFTYVDDVMEAFWGLLNEPKCRNNVFNVGNPKETSVRELAEQVRETLNPKINISTMTHAEHYGKSYEDIDRRVPDIKKIRSFIGWEPKTSLKQGIEATAAALKERPTQGPAADL